MTFSASIVTLFPDAFPGALGLSHIGRALSEGRWSLETIDLRAFGQGPHKQVDDTPAGGGPGMVIRADVAAAAIDSIRRNGRPLLYPSPRGRPFTQALARDWSHGDGLIVFCGRFEGLDERAIDARGMLEVSVGDVVLAGGEIAAMLILEAVLRLRPGVLGNSDSLSEESFVAGLLEQPHYTRPRVFEDRPIPEVLLSGDHARIEAWRKAERERITRARRPDLLPNPKPAPPES
ncbi:MAG: tRNA (guanosine(37)-N1)-methyltransferase TrmD [Alphaproteobacteria bacterium]|nr:tRNA (guanosine(37)-N1)-methyltransferase TrmD [Alphaproteobacteria bacterium]